MASVLETSSALTAPDHSRNTEGTTLPVLRQSTAQNDPGGPCDADHGFRAGPGLDCCSRGFRRKSAMLSRLLCLAAAACLMAATSVAKASGPVYFNPDASGSTSFVMPSGNVGCIFTPVGGSSVYAVS